MVYSCFFWEAILGDSILYIFTGGESYSAIIICQESWVHKKTSTHVAHESIHHIAFVERFCRATTIWYYTGSMSQREFRVQEAISSAIRIAAH